MFDFFLFFCFSYLVFDSFFFFFWCFCFFFVSFIRKFKSILFHYSYESGILENPAIPAPIELCKMTTNLEYCPDEPEEIEITFTKGYPSSVQNLDNCYVIDNPLEIIEYLNEIGGKHGIGRIDIVENRYIGLKVINGRISIKSIKLRLLAILFVIFSLYFSFSFSFSLVEFTKHRAVRFYTRLIRI